MPSVAIAQKQDNSVDNLRFPVCDEQVLPRDDLETLRGEGGRDDGDATGSDNDAVIAEINASAPQALLVAMGFPSQERWIAANLSRLKVNVAIAEGGSFSFISGMTRRAPLWMRRAGLEWLFRLLRQPWRLRRQLALPPFVWLVLKDRLQRAGVRY